MEQYIVNGMSCASCAMHVEKAVLDVKGVTSCSVNLLTNSMQVEGTALSKDIIKAVEKAGYQASLKTNKAVNSNSLNTNDEDILKDKESPILVKRLIISLAFWIILMYISMGHMMWGWPLPAFIANNHVNMGLLQLLLTTVILVINQKFFVSGFKAILHRAPNMDTLVALGSAAAFIYSTVSLFAMIDAQGKGDMNSVKTYMDEFYFESAATIVTLITFGKMLEARSKGKTTNALKGLMRLSPKTATILRDEKEIVVSIEQVVKGDIFVVRPGESIPVDGVVIKGSSAVDESGLSGESIPVDKAEGSMVSSGSINQSGYLQCEATRVGQDTTLSQIIQMVSNAAASKAPIAKIADKVSGVFVPTVMAIATITFIVWLIVGRGISFSLARAISVLVISCPCALGLATPVAIMVGNGIGAKNGILFKTAVSLEETGKANIVALDKTGTITQGKPTVTDMFPCIGKSDEELLTIAYSLEKKSEHPLAKAINVKAQEKLIEAYEVDNFIIMPGNGLSANKGKDVLLGGNYKYISSQLTIPDEMKSKADEYSLEGKTPMFFAKNNEIVGIIAVADIIKEDSILAIKQLHDMGLYVAMITGDNERTAKAIGAKIGVDEIFAEVLPKDKGDIVQKMQQKGKVIMVGDGINDAPALTSANIGIAIGAGSDIALDAADVILMKNNLSDVAAAIRLSRATFLNIKENLFWAFIYNIIGIPLAAGVFINLFGWQLNPMFAAAAMSLSSVSVVLNALRLNLININKPKQNIINARKINKIEDIKTMEKTILIEGMMCSHCEMHVKNALESIDGVTSVNVSYKEGKAVIFANKQISNDKIEDVISKEGYKVVEIK